VERKKVNEIEIAYQLSGEGPPLVLISGLGYGGWYWHKVLPGLAQHYQVLTFDNRGAGESDQPDGPYTVPMMAADTIGLLDALNIQGANIFGHSLGGFIAQEVVLQRPDLVSKLILASTTHGGTQVIPITPEALQVMTDREGEPLELVKRGIAIACAAGFSEKQPEVVQELIQYRFSNPVPPAQYQAQVAAGAGTAAFTQEEVIDRMAQITIPVLILFGEQDQVVPPGNADLMAQKLSNAQIKILPGTGHMFPIEDPEATVKAVIDFLKQ